jgi:glutamate/tyrosine decarboxylase-like PLP-dependent enzyme
MYNILQHDLDGLDNILTATQQEALSFLQEIDKVSTQPDGVNMPRISLPEDGLGAAESLVQFQQYFKKVISSSPGPRYWGFVTGGSTPAALAGDWLATVYDQNTQRYNLGGDCSAIIEKHTLQLCKELFGLPETFSGGFVTGATISNFTCLAVARQWAGKQLGLDIAREGIGNSNIIVMSAEPHSSVVKCLSMLGMGSNNVVAIKKLEDNREAMDVQDLALQLEKYKTYAVIVVASGGTVNTVDYDDMEAIALLQKQHNFWWHIDAAFGGFAACSKTHAHKLSGWQYADSITIDNHKWMNVPYENALFFIQEQHSALQMQTFQNSNAPYLGNPEENFSYANYLPENSRRLKALPVWFTLMAYGKQGYEAIVENSIALANEFANAITANNCFELLAPVRLNTVCFTLANNEERVAAFLEKLNATGKVFMTPTVYKGRKGIRAAFVNWRTTIKDVDMVVALMHELV